MYGECLSWDHKRKQVLRAQISKEKSHLWENTLRKRMGKEKDGDGKYLDSFPISTKYVK